MIAQAMTSKDIAAAVGKPERTVRRWIENLAAKSAVVAAKLAASSPREAERDRNYQSFWHRHEVERIIAHLEAKS